eukprot:IDg13552t1
MLIKDAHPIAFARPSLTSLRTHHHSQFYDLPDMVSRNENVELAYEYAVDIIIEQGQALRDAVRATLDEKRIKINGFTRCHSFCNRRGDTASVRSVGCSPAKTIPKEQDIAAICR